MPMGYWYLPSHWMGDRCVERLVWAVGKSRRAALVLGRLCHDGAGGRCGERLGVDLYILEI